MRVSKLESGDLFQSMQQMLVGLRNEVEQKGQRILELEEVRKGRQMCGCSDCLASYVYYES